MCFVISYAKLSLGSNNIWVHLQIDVDDIENLKWRWEWSTLSSLSYNCGTCLVSYESVFKKIFVLKNENEDKDENDHSYHHEATISSCSFPQNVHESLF